MWQINCFSTCFSISIQYLFIIYEHIVVRGRVWYACFRGPLLSTPIGKVEPGMRVLNAYHRVDERGDTCARVCTSSPRLLVPPSPPVWWETPWRLSYLPLNFFRPLYHLYTPPVGYTVCLIKFCAGPTWVVLELSWHPASAAAEWGCIWGVQARVCGTQQVRPHIGEALIVHIWTEIRHYTDRTIDRHHLLVESEPHLGNHNHNRHHRLHAQLEEQLQLGVNVQPQEARGISV